MRTRIETDGSDAAWVAMLEEIAAAAGANEETRGRAIAQEQAAARIDEGFALLIGCAMHFAALAAEGLTEGETRTFRRLLEALKSAQALVARQTERCGAADARATSVRDRLFDAVGDAAGRLRARAAFAFRFDPGDARRRAFSSAYAPRRPSHPARRAALRDAVELKLR